MAAIRYVCGIYTYGVDYYKHNVDKQGFWWLIRVGTLEG